MTLQPLETIAATGITGLLISLGAKGVAATLVKRANAYLKIADALIAAETGDVTSLIGTLTTVISTSDLDPAEGLALTGLLTAIVNQLALAKSLTGETLLGTAVTTFLNNLATGMEAGANAEIAKYGSAAAAPAAASAAI
jgi:hypothetical protein